MEMDLPPPAPNLRLHQPPDLLDLPADVLDMILVRAPIRDAVRTSALSRPWRHRWQSIPTLTFLDPSPASVDAVLLLHSSPLLRFCLVTDSPDHSHRWLAALSRRHPSALLSLHLAFRRFDPPRPVHSSVSSSFPELDSLVLAGCSLSPPPSFRGFPTLKKLVLRDVALPDELSLSGLVSRCPSLVELVLVRVNPPTIGLCIASPKLRLFRFRGNFNGVYFTGGQVLDRVSVVLEEDNEMDVGLAEMFCGSAVCQGKLKLHGLTVEALAKLDIPKSIPISFCMLMVLKMRIDWVERRHIMLLFCLLRSAPNLEELYLQGSSTSFVYDWNMPVPGEDFWEQESVDRLGNLRILEMDDTVFSISGMRFMHLVLAKAPVLEKLATVSASKLDWNDYLFELFNYRASTQLQIVYINKQEEGDEEVEEENEDEDEEVEEVDEDEDEEDEEVEEEEVEEVNEDEDEEDEEVEQEEVDEDEDEEDEEVEEEEVDEDEDEEDEEVEQEEVEEVDEDEDEEDEEVEEEEEDEDEEEEEEEEVGDEDKDEEDEVGQKEEAEEEKN